MKWHFLDTGFNPGTYNMKTDIRLATALLQGQGTPTLRTYGWKPYAISIGMNQSIEEFDLEILNTAGIDIVRRPTGGRAILHADELTYSVTLPAGDRTLREIYRFVNEGLLCGLRLMGVDAELSSTAEDFRNLYRQPASIPCFASSAKSEIQVGGRKILGSAQRRYGNSVLQHGSLLLTPKHRDIVHYLSADLRNVKSAVSTELDRHAVDLETVLGRTISYHEAVENIREGFTRGCGIEFVHTAEAVAPPAEAWFTEGSYCRPSS